MTWRDNLRAASSEDGFIIANGSGASMIPQNTNWHDNYMNSFTEDGIKIANLKDAVSQVETLPQEADTGSLYYLTTGANPGMYYYDGTQWVAVGGGGGITNFRVLTDDDLVNGSYRLYELPSGAYVVPKTNPNHTAYVSSMSYGYSADNQLAIVSHGDSHTQVLFLSASPSYGAVYVEENAYGTEYRRTKLATMKDVETISGELIDAWSTKDWPQTNPDGVALWKIDLSNNSDRFYLTSNNNVKLYITPSHSITGNIRGEIKRVRTGGTANKTLVCFDLGVWDRANNDDMYGIKGYGVVDANNDVELDYKIYATTAANSQDDANQSSSSSEDPGEDPGEEPGSGVVEPTVTCPFCGQQTPANSTICQICGKDISGGATPDPEEPIAPEEPTEEPAEG